MKIFVLEEKEVNKRVAKRFARLVNHKKNPVIGLATGSTPVGVYQEIVKLYNNNKVNFKNTVSFNLDEYLDLGNQKDSYRTFMNDNLINYINIKESHMPEDGSYDDKIASYGGIDIQLLGIGRDGHIAFNEPQTSFDSKTHVTEILEVTRNDNKRFFDDKDEVPHRAITMGLQTIMNAKRIILIAFGKNKAEAVKQMIHGKIDISCPASILQKHPKVEVFLDQEAASLL